MALVPLGTGGFHEIATICVYRSTTDGCLDRGQRCPSARVSVAHRSAARRAIGHSEVVDLNGLRTSRSATTEVELTGGAPAHRRRRLRTTLAGHDTISPIFADDRLVLLWLGDTGGTPEGVTPVRR